MKKISIIIGLLLVVLTSCEKNEFDNGGSVPIKTDHFRYDWFLDISAFPKAQSDTTTGDTIKFYKLSPTEFNKMSDELGQVIYFYSDNNSMFEVIHYNGSVTTIWGVLNGHSFIANMSDSTMNICRGQQNVPFTFRLYN